MMDEDREYTDREGRVYTSLDHRQFVEDMEEAGLEVWHYQGRFLWEGPAVEVDDLQDALGVTDVKCQWDNMGLGWVVYPRSYGSFEEEVGE